MATDSRDADGKARSKGSCRTCRIYRLALLCTLAAWALSWWLIPR